MFLYEEIENLKKHHFHQPIPQFVIDNLSPSIKLRDYQKNAFENFLIYLNDEEFHKNKHTHLLYHMATGSGKTIIMAMSILYYYSIGYRNFLFFTNQTNIISKTKINFMSKKSSKYLFNDIISIFGNNIKIKEVQNFQSTDSDAINICFNTVQGIHSALGIIKENSLTIDDFIDNKVVLIADEAHHLNSTTSKDKEIKEDNKTWENTINSILFANKDNILLEFTATCDIKDHNVLSKYLDKMIFNFNLKEFREAGYTKEFANMQTNTDKWTRSIQAIIMSEYRKLKFSSKNIDANPVVLLKSKTIKESNAFYEEFYNNLKALNGKFITQIKSNNSNNLLFDNAFKFFDSINLTADELAALIKVDFSEDNSVNMNEINAQNELIVNSLDEPNNHYRIIFIVDKLTEGWDVLSLFDIVRLYETRQGGPKGKPSDYTISEAQLIGRGARYYPFKFSEEQNPVKRKYSNYLDENAICETLLYHCMQDSRYISEIQLALKQTGLMPEEEPIKIEYVLKKGFKKTHTYLEGLVFLNDRVVVSRDSVHELPYNIRTQNVIYKCSSSAISSLLLNEDKEETGKEKDQRIIKINEIWYPIVYKAFRCFHSTLSFDKLKKQFPHLQSIQQFLTSDNYLGILPITFIFDKESKITNKDKFEACKKMFETISNYVTKIEITFKGTNEFIGYPIAERFKDSIIRNYNRDKEDLSWGNGVSQASGMVDEQYRLDLSTIDWYVYNDNCGTSEEKKFVKYFSTIVSDLKSRYDQVYLIRNELKVAIYDFDTGDKFEPDYLLFLRKKGEQNLSINIFIEPKGEHLLQKDDWKNKLLLSLHDKGIPTTKYVEDDKYLIWGTPLYNETKTKKDFVDYIKKTLKEIECK